MSRAGKWPAGAVTYCLRLCVRVWAGGRGYLAWKRSASASESSVSLRSAAESPNVQPQRSCSRWRLHALFCCESWQQLL